MLSIGGRIPPQVRVKKAKYFWYKSIFARKGFYSLRQFLGFCEIHYSESFGFAKFPARRHGPPFSQLKSQSCFSSEAMTMGRRNSAMKFTASRNVFGASVKLLRRRKALHWATFEGLVAKASVKQVGPVINGVPRWEKVLSIAREKPPF